MKRYYLAAILLHLVVLFWVNPSSGQTVPPKKPERYLEVTLSSEPGPAQPGPDSGPGDKAKSSVRPGPMVDDSPPPVATITQEVAPPLPTPEPPPDILPPEPLPTPVLAEPTPVAVAPPPPVEPSLIPTPTPPPVTQPPPATPPVEVNSSPSPTQSGTLSGAPVSGTGKGNAIQWSLGTGGNGHFYEAVCVPEGITWDDAQKYALLHNGYLATIASAAENLYVFKLIDDPKYWRPSAMSYYNLGPWIGAFKTPYGWQWLNGEGQATYTHWAARQPDNARGIQARVHYYSWQPNVRQPTWDDLENEDLQRGFVVEYDHDPASLPLNTAAAAAFTEPVGIAPPPPPPSPFRKR